MPEALYLITHRLGGGEGPHARLTKSTKIQLRRNPMDLNQMKEVTKEVLMASTDVYDQDAVLADMFAKGIPFGKLKSLYRKVGVDEGLIADPAEVKESISNAVEEAEIEAFEAYGEVEELAAGIAKDIEGADETAVIRAIKAYCRDNDIDVPAKKAGGGGPRVGGGTTGKAIVTYFNTTPLESISKRGMYDAVLPVVKGPKNAYDNVNMHFLNNYAVKSGLDYDAAIEAVKQMDVLKLEDLQKEFDAAPADGGAEGATEEMM